MGEETEEQKAWDKFEKYTSMVELIIDLTNQQQIAIRSQGKQIEGLIERIKRLESKVNDKK